MRPSATENPRDACTASPITIKSSIAAAGFRLECGSHLRRGQVAQRDATLVAKLKAAGAIVLGTTNVPEFLMAYETDNHLYGRTFLLSTPAILPAAPAAANPRRSPRGAPPPASAATPAGRCAYPPISAASTH